MFMTSVPTKAIDHSPPDKDAPIIMSSMLKRVLAPLLLAASVAAVASTLVPELPLRVPTESTSVTSGGAVRVSPGVPAVSTSVYDPLRGAISEWSRLRQSDGYPFSDYARFLIAHPGWPGETGLRKAAERRIDPNNYSASQVVSFFTSFPPLTNTGRARYAEALSALGRPVDARAQAQAAWTGGPLNPDDESRLLGRFGSQFTTVDHDRRMEALLWKQATTAALRQIAWTSAARRPLYEARLAMQARQVDAADKAAAVGPAADRDPGFVADRTRWLRDTGQSMAARTYLAAPRQFDAPPFDPEAWLDLVLTIARAAANDNQWSIAYDIASKVDATYPPGTAVRDRSLSERDAYTSIVWLAGTAALKKLGRPTDAIGMFERYARAAQNPQTQSKGYYWAGRAAQAAGDKLGADAWYAQAAQQVDQFYGQLATERLGRTIAIPPEPPVIPIAPEQRAAFQSQEIVRAARLLGQSGQWQDQTLFVRAIAQATKTDVDHVLVGELARDLQRPDLGVMVSRVARNNGTRDPVRIGFPRVTVPAAMEGQWTMIHAISRQESQFDRQATSPVGAKGLMQLMPATARETAAKLGLDYSYDRLTSDPSYNVMLGSAFFSRMLEYYGGSHVLAAAAYNAGPGNVNRWIAANGDPRMPGVDVVDWIEAIPLSETRAYVQRVLENAVVYDLLNPDRARMRGQTRLSAYLGQRAATQQACANDAGFQWKPPAGTC
jgi:soluble lytic murein transglycosylase